ncbi:MAG TPA: cation:proton antiporter, partial [Gammaproteobacteria bacterium]|nr:cation:proton antiporter [Gammaproteobacteria bacterium]
KLFALRYAVFAMGGLQVILTITFTTAIGVFLGMSVLQALVVGSIVSMSSTAIVVKQLNDQFELQSPHGLNSIGVLLFQDLAVIPIIILIAGLAKGAEHSLSSILLWALVKGIFAIFLIFLIGRLLLRPLFRQISKTRDIELFTLTVLLVTLTGAWLTNLFGLSYALGAFLSGLMLAETEFRHQIEVEIRPFRDILLGLFFITIGMLTNVSTWADTWFWILLLVVALVLGKMLLITFISRLLGNNSPTSLRTGIILSQGGEFGFAVLTLSLSNGILPEDYGQVVLAALLISIALSPILIRFNKQIAELFFQKTVKLNEEKILEKINLKAKKIKKHVILCGYGRVGQHIARVLDNVKFPYLGLDLDNELIRFASLTGDNVIYGDPTHPGILKAAGLDNAKVLVISFNDLRASIKILSMVKETHPNLPIIIRCRDEYELKQLKKYGATHIIAELFEASLALSHHLLDVLKIPENKISELLHEVRSKDYDMLQKIFIGAYEETMADHQNPSGQVKPILIPEGAFAANKKLKDLHLKSMNVEIISIRRNEKKFLKPENNTTLKAYDIIMLYGTLFDLEEAERYLLKG